MSAAGVPRGSFFHHFPTKEDLGLDVLRRYAGHGAVARDAFFTDQAYPPLIRLRRMFSAADDQIVADSYQKGCLVGNLCQEMADRSEGFRTALDTVATATIQQIAVVLDEARSTGDLPVEAPTAIPAETLWASWEGALLRAKTSRSSEPLKAWEVVMFDLLLAS